MREYEELVLDNRNMAKNEEEEEEEVEEESLSEEDKLSTIEETGSLEVQVTEWEEEIACLRQQLEEQERSMEVRMRACEEEWRARLDAAEREEREARCRLEELRWRLREGDNSSMMAEYPSTAEDSPRRVEEAMVASSSSSSIVSPSPRKDLEPSWVHQAATLPRCFSQSRLSSSSSSPFTTSLAISPRQGPASLPAELVNSAQREVRRLQELRRYIQEECDQLLLRKERLREEIVLGDIAREKAAVEKELSKGVSGGGAGLDRILFHSLKQKLTNQVNRCGQLQAALAEQKEQTQSILSVMREQHEAEMCQLESLVSSSRGLLRKQNKRFLEQVDKLVLADSVTEQLLVDNDRLTNELGKLKENFKVTDI